MYKLHSITTHDTVYIAPVSTLKEVGQTELGLQFDLVLLTYLQFYSVLRGT